MNHYFRVNKVVTADVKRESFEEAGGEEGLGPKGPYLAGRRKPVNIEGMLTSNKKNERVDRKPKLTLQRHDKLGPL